MNYCANTGKECYGQSELPLLFEISKLINTSRNINEILYPSVKLLAEYIQAEKALLTIINRSNNEIYIEVGHGISSEIKNRTIYKMGEGVIGEVIKTGESLYIPKIAEDRRFLNKTKGRLQTLSRQDISFICVPIKVDDVIAGSLSIHRNYNDKSDHKELIRVLCIVGSMLANAVKLRQEESEEKQRLEQENKSLRIELQERYNFTSIVGNSGAMKEVYKLILSVATKQATVLIRGESGVGKELIADAIHYNSSRANKSIVKVNCSALPETLIESELFGYEKGAFTGAEGMKQGRFDLAEGGTIFLDEIGDIPLSTQVKLLRVLQQRQFERVGGTKTIDSDVRVIAATNRNLEAMIKEGKFREDLYYRINVFPVFIPPLRERIEDISQLIDHFIDKTNKSQGTAIKRISSSALEMLMIYNWPGNIRELENCIERASILAEDGVIRSNNLPPTLQTAVSSGTETNSTLQTVLDKVEKQLILEALTETKGSVLDASKKLGITERILGLRLQKYNIDFRKYRSLKSKADYEN